jgi:hypothetical protein
VTHTRRLSLPSTNLTPAITRSNISTINFATSPIPRGLAQSVELKGGRIFRHLFLIAHRARLKSTDSPQSSAPPGITERHTFPLPLPSFSGLYVFHLGPDSREVRRNVPIVVLLVAHGAAVCPPWSPFHPLQHLSPRSIEHCCYAMIASIAIQLRLFKSTQQRDATSSSRPCIIILLSIRPAAHPADDQTLRILESCFIYLHDLVRDLRSRNNRCDGGRDGGRAGGRDCGRRLG